MKKPISIVLLLCMIVSLFTGIVFAVEETPQPEETVAAEKLPEEAAAEEAETEAPDAEATEAEAEAEETEPAAEPAETEVPEETEAPELSIGEALKSVWNAKLFVAPNADAGLTGRVAVKLDLLKLTGTLYLPGKADASALCFSWDDPNVTITKDDVAYASGTAPIAPAGESVTYTVTCGEISSPVTIKTVQGSAAVEPMFLELDESLGTIDAMNADDEHETRCFGKVLFDGNDNYVSIKGRGNSTWVFPKKPYNITLHKDDTYDKKEKVVYIPGVKKCNKYCLLANYLDNSLIRNKVAMDLAVGLGIGLESRFIDLWMNGEYLGSYLMTPKKDLNVKDKGFMLDNDHIPEDVDQFKIAGMHDMFLKHNRINIEEIGDDLVEQGIDQAYLEAYFNEAFAALTNYDTEDYLNYFDLDSWAKMFLMVEVSKTYDCYAGNFLMRRDGLKPEDKLIAGPAWDYDIAFGRTLHKFLVWITEPMQLNAEGWYNDSIGAMVVDEPVSLLQELGKHASFMRAVARVYNENKALFEDLAANVDRQREEIRASALMNNDLWGTHSLSADYLVAPNTMSLLGTGKYALHYDVTLTWDNYVNNLREFCTKRVMWLSDHLWTETPEGYIVKKALANGSVQLQVVLSAGSQKNSYQWQVFEGGEWKDLPDATARKLKLNPDDPGETNYRCIVTNECAVIHQYHGGSVPTYAAATLDPATVTVYMKDEALRPGKLTLTLDGEDVGEFTFERAEDGWMIRRDDGRYLNASIWGEYWSKDPLVWQYTDGVFQTTVMAARTTLGKLITLGYLIDIQITANGDAIDVTTGSGMQAGFLVSVAE